MSTPEHSPLGKTTVYADRYDASLLFPIPRQAKRDEIGVTGPLPFHGEDVWNAYELSWLDGRGKPVVALAEFRVPAGSPNIIESKSFKLYLNGFSQERVTDRAALIATLTRDLSAAAGAPIDVTLTDPQARGHAVTDLDGTLVDDLAIDIDDYKVNIVELGQRIAAVVCPLVMCGTKSGGAHLFLFVAEPIQATLMRARLQDSASRLGCGSSEVFPKQTTVNWEAGEFGSWLNMPYFGGTRWAYQ